MIQQRQGSDRKKSDLPHAQRRLVEAVQQLHFGRLEFAVRGGTPSFTPPPRAVRTVKIGGRNEPRPQTAATDFALKREFIELFDQIGSLGDASVRIDVAHGLPLRVEVEESLSLN